MSFWKNSSKVCNVFAQSWEKLLVFRTLYTNRQTMWRHLTSVFFNLWTRWQILVNSYISYYLFYLNHYVFFFNSHNSLFKEILSVSYECKTWICNPKEMIIILAHRQTLKGLWNPIGKHSRPRSFCLKAAFQLVSGQWQWIRSALEIVIFVSYQK